MKKLIIMAVTLVIFSGCQQENPKNTFKLNQETYMKELQEIIRAYENYYQSAEHLLDHLPEDDSIWISKESTNYFKDRYILDSIFNQYEYNPHYKHQTLNKTYNPNKQ